jgi:hypothetical protein
MCRRLSSADDADQELIIGIWVGVNYDQDHNAPYDPDSMPPLLAVLEPVRDNQMKRIVPDKSCGFEIDAVFDEV